MIKASLERFDTPVVIVNQVFEGEDWGVVASYVSAQDALRSEGDEKLFAVGWNVSVTLPSLDDVDFTQVFSTPEAALEFGMNEILSGRLRLTTSNVTGIQGDGFPFGQYHSVA